MIPFDNVAFVSEYWSRYLVSTTFYR